MRRANINSKQKGNIMQTGSTSRRRDLVPIWVSKAAGTADLARRCKELTPADTFGRRATIYTVVHEALTIHLAKLKKANKAAESETSPENGPKKEGTFKP